MYSAAQFEPLLLAVPATLVISPTAVTVVPSGRIPSDFSVPIFFTPCHKSAPTLNKLVATSSPAPSD